MADKLVIVESPTKAKTISKFLGKEFTVMSSFGHIRDLPKSKMGVDVDGDFSPDYVIPKDKQKKVTELKKLANKASEIYYATDEDREGEAISWHLQQIFEAPEDKIKRIVFHEITKEAILESLESPRTIDFNLVEAQQARRILDRLVGYELSPLLWKKIARGLSAGRVQSVAVRLIVEREREIEAFDPQEYWSIHALLNNDKDNFEAVLAKKDGKTLDKFAINNEKDATEIVKKLEKEPFTVDDITQKTVNKKPYPPFTTSTLQQAANTILGYSAKQTMVLAQQLYEGIDLGSEGAVGLITYMRTDSTTLAKRFQAEAASHVESEYGKEYVEVKQFAGKTKNAQEAHEAVRPTSASRTPESIKTHLDSKQFKLYQLIWQRAVASQMKPAKTKQTTIAIAANVYTFRVSGSVIDFPGWLKVYPDKIQENELPQVEKGQTLKLEKIRPEQHFTQPPGRYTEASLVKKLEELGIGRPSTYAPTISTVQARNYVYKEGNALKPTDVAKLVTDLLVEHFPNIVDFDFTAEVENEFDEISNGNLERVTMLQKFYKPFHATIEEKEESITKEEATEMKELGKHPETDKPIYVRIGRFGPFVQHGSKDDEEKPVFASIPKELSIETITLDQALHLLKLPRVVYSDTDDGDIIVNIGRYGPYLQLGKKYISLKEDDPYEIEEARARELVAEYKKKEAEKIIKTFEGTDIIVQHGRYGPYITDGKTNAKIPKDTEPESLTQAQCEELLEEAAKKPKRGRGRKK
ncbi:MAG: type I DNA topoisomerase [Patescibacteria group bacterium]